MSRVAIVMIIVLLASSCFSLEMRRRAAQLEFEKGMRFYNNIDIRAAKQAFMHAVRLDPSHQKAKVYLRQAKRMLGEPEDWE